MTEESQPYGPWPPSMPNENSFPPKESEKSEISKSSLGVDDVRDPDYAWEDIPHQRHEGFLKWKAGEKNKHDNVKGYTAIRSRYWKYVTENIVTNEKTETVEVTIGSSGSSQTTLTALLKTEFGIEDAGIGVKLEASLSFEKTDVATFSKTTKTSVTQEVKPGLYFTWQVCEDIQLFRILKKNPSEPQVMHTITGRSGNAQIVRAKYQRGS